MLFIVKELLKNIDLMYKIHNSHVKRCDFFGQTVTLIHQIKL